MAIRYNASIAQFMYWPNALQSSAFPATAMCWVYPVTTPAASNYHDYLTFSEGTGTGAGVSVFNSGGAKWNLGTNTTDNLGSPSATVTAGTWYHIALVIHNATSKSLYVNGIKIVTATTPSGETSTTLISGKFGTSGSSFSNGRVYAIKSWGAALSHPEILAEMWTVVPLRTDAIRVWSPLESYERTADYGPYHVPYTKGVESVAFEQNPPFVSWSKFTPNRYQVLLNQQALSNSYDEESSGGCFLSGSTIAALIAEFSGQGGAILDGLGEQAQTQPISGLGGAVISGRGATDAELDATGGATVSGSSSQEYTGILSTSGGALAGGTGIAGGAGTILSSGGVITSGTHTLSKVSNMSSSGGVILDINTSSISLLEFVNSGGVVTEREHSFGNEYFMFSSGGTVLSGTNTTGSSFSYSGSGGVIGRGSISGGLLFILSSTAQANVSGQASIIKMFGSTSSGGITIDGGYSILGQISSFNASGGIVLSGSNSPDKTSSITGLGGIQLSGASVTTTGFTLETVGGTNVSGFGSFGSFIDAATTGAITLSGGLEELVISTELDSTASILTSGDSSSSTDYSLNLDPSGVTISGENTYTIDNTVESSGGLVVGGFVSSPSVFTDMSIGGVVAAGTCVVINITEELTRYYYTITFSNVVLIDSITFD